MASTIRRGTAILISIGLVLVGLLGGILIMLVIGPQNEPAPTPRIVDRVQLGSPDPVVRPADADSALRRQPPQPTALNQLFREVAVRVTPAVVFIQVELEAPESSDNQYREFDGDMRDFFRGPAPRQSVGSGVIISDEGYVATNNHVVERAERIRVTLSDKRQFEAEVIGTDASTDLAVLKIPGANLTSIPLGDSDRMEVGDWVIAVGNPFRLTSTVTAGIVSALGRQVNIINDTFSIEDFIQTDAAINPGNSGGALVNLEGELVGINTAIATESGSYEGYGFAVPTNLMERVVRDLIAFGEVRRGYLGISIGEVNAGMARDLGLDPIRGVYISSVSDGGAADRAGIKNGDVILAINGRMVDAPNELQSAVARNRPGDWIDVNVWRGGREEDVSVQLMARGDWANETLAEQPADDLPSLPQQEEEPPLELYEFEAWGVGLRDVNEREQQTYDVDGGVYVAYVENGSRADEIGFPRDVVITHVDDQPIGSLDDLKTYASQQDSGVVLVQVQRRDGTSAYYELDDLGAR